MSMKLKKKVKELEEKQWDISSELDKKGDIKLFNKIIELLAKLYKKMKNLLNEQQSEGREVVTRLENQLGNNITEKNLWRIVETANSFYGKLREANIKYAPDVASDIEKYDDDKYENDKYDDDKYEKDDDKYDDDRYDHDDDNDNDHDNDHDDRYDD